MNREWHIHFERNFNDWEVDGVASFFHLIQTKLPTHEDNDGIQWGLKKNGAFDIFFLISKKISIKEQT